MEKCRDRAVWLVRFGQAPEQGGFTALVDERDGESEGLLDASWSG